MERKTIDKIPEHETKVFHCSQGDNNRLAIIDLCDGLEVGALTGSEAVRVRYKLPNGEIGVLPLANYGGSYLNFIITNAVTEIPGTVYCKLWVDSIGYKAFFIMVEGR